MKIRSKTLVFGGVALSSKLLSSIKPVTPARPLSSYTNKPTAKTEKQQSFSPISKRDSLILEKFRQRHLKGSLKSNSDSVTEKQQTSAIAPNSASTVRESKQVGFENDKSGSEKIVSSFQELGLNNEITGALSEMGIWVPSEIQCVGIPALLDGKSVVLSSDSGSGRTLAYLLPLIQMLRRGDALLSMKPKHPRAIVLCASDELCDQTFQVARFINHQLKLKSSTETDSGKSRTSEKLSNDSIGLLVATPSETIQYMEGGSVVPDDIKYLVLDEMDVMFNHGFGSEIYKILSPLKTHASKGKDFGLQTVLVTSAITKMLGKQMSPLTQQLEQNKSGNVAAMMLEMDQQEVFDLAESLDALKTKVAEAINSFRLS